jgi:hypothetical protein
MKKFISLRWYSPVVRALPPLNKNGRNKNAYADLILPGTPPASSILLLTVYPGVIFKNETP